MSNAASAPGAGGEALSRRRSVALTATGMFYVLALFGVVAPSVAAAHGSAVAVWLFNTVAVMLYGVLSLLLLYRQPSDLRARMFAFTGFGVSLSLLFSAATISAVPGPVTTLYVVLDNLIYMLLFAVIIHMAAVIPYRNPIAERHPWIIWGAYALGGVMVVVGTVAVLNAIGRFLPWGWSLASANRLQFELNVSSYVVAGLGALALVGYAARYAVTAEARRQAVVVFVGLVPWTLYVLLRLVFPTPTEGPILALVEAIAIVVVPIALFISIARYRLFEVGAILRRGLIYGASIVVLATVLYLAAAALEQLARRVLGTGASMWGLAVLLIMGAVVLRPLVHSMGRVIDRRFFPEKYELHELRDTLIPELAEFTSVEDAAGYLVRRVGMALELRGAALLLPDQTGQFFRMRAAWGHGLAAANGDMASPLLVTRAELRQWDELLAQGHPFRRLHGVPERGELRRTLDRLGATVVVPVKLKTRLIGLMLLSPAVPGRDPEEGDLDLMEDIARQASAMLENARLGDLAHRDALTRLPRRQVASERLAFEVERSRRALRPFGVAMADLDDFKRVNDTWGHHAGDAVLRAVAQCFAEQCRRIDMVARWGGEEFLFIFAESPGEGARLHAERLRAAVDALLVPVSDDGRQTVHVTVSMGVCAVAGGPTTPEPYELIRCADAALYRAKRAGKNRVAFSGQVARAAP